MKAKIKWPRMVRIAQHFDDQPQIENPQDEAARALANALPDKTPLRRKRIAVAVGSRGIAELVPIMRGIVDELRRRGANPFLVPAMGSHGGATAEGQRAVLTSLGITEKTVGAPIISSMETVELGRTENDFPVVLDRHAYEADGIIVVNRIKPHTEFSGPYQSGLLKMLLIGLGKHTGAILYHRAATRIPFEQLIRTAGRVVLERASVLAGVAIVENAREGVAQIVGVRPEEFFETEARLLEQATRYMATIPFDEIDLLIIDEMGKNISGAGMDTNVIRRKHWAHTAVGEQIDAAAPKRIFVRDLTDESQGNAAGVGMADFVLRRLVEKIDWHKTYTNTITATRPRGAMLPLVFEADEEAIRQALLSAGVDDPANARIARIKNTLSLVHMEVSEPLMTHVHDSARVETLGKAELVFDENGMLVPDKLPSEASPDPSLRSSK